MSPAKRAPKPKSPAKRKATAKPYTAYLCSHTHWDREWYGTFQQFRMRLVRLVDRLMDLLERDPDFRCFNLDGQTIVLEDYLEVKPEQRPRLERLIREGRIAIGPWYILPDEWLVSGESTVRNILRGRAICREFGVEPPRVGYLPDMFGHISQIPQILRGAGIDATIFWRGLSGDEYKSEVWWESPDGSRVLGFHLPESNGYANTSFFFASLPPEVRELAPGKGWGHVCTDDLDFTVRAMRAVTDRCIAQSRSGVLLFMNGVDHMEANPRVPEIIRRVNAEFPDVEVRHSTFGEFMDALRARAPKDLQVVRGECRSTAVAKNSGAIVLPNILSSRIYLKTANATCQTLLERWAEPFSCAAAMAGAEYPEGLIRTAWKWVLQNHPHDSIGGCSADAVHRQMETRFEWAEEIAETVTSMALYAVTKATDTSGLDEKELAYQLFNPLNWEVTDLVRVKMDVDDTWFAANGIELNHENIYRSVRNIGITDSDGRPVKFEIEDIEFLIQHRPWTEVFNSTYWTVRFHVALWAEKVPAMGYKGYRLRTAAKPYRLDDRHGTGNPARMSNGLLTVDVNPNGTLDISGPALGRTTLKGAHWLEDGGDNGDGYTYSMPRHDGVVTSLGCNAQITRIADSKALQALAVDYTLDVPAAVTPDRQHRAAETAPLKVRSVFRLGGLPPYRCGDQHHQQRQGPPSARVLRRSGGGKDTPRRGTVRHRRTRQPHSAAADGDVGGGPAARASHGQLRHLLEPRVGGFRDPRVRTGGGRPHRAEADADARGQLPWRVDPCQYAAGRRGTLHRDAGTADDRQAAGAALLHRAARRRLARGRCPARGLPVRGALARVCHGPPWRRASRRGRVLRVCGGQRYRGLRAQTGGGAAGAVRGSLLELR